MVEQCPHCGASLPEAGDAYCPECRESVEVPAPSPRPGRGLFGQGLFGQDLLAESTPEDADTHLSEIAGLEGLSHDQILWELGHGAKFVEYQFCISFLVVTIFRPSRIHFIRSHESAVARGMKYTLLSLAAGWWGLPFGPLCTLAAVAINLCGGRNVTPTSGMMEALQG